MTTPLPEHVFAAAWEKIGGLSLFINDDEHSKSVVRTVVQHVWTSGAAAGISTEATRHIMAQATAPPEAVKKLEEDAVKKAAAKFDKERTYHRWVFVGALMAMAFALFSLVFATIAKSPIVAAATLMLGMLFTAGSSVLGAGLWKARKT